MLMFGAYPTPESQTIHIIAYEFPRIPLLRTTMNKAKNRGRSCFAAASFSRAGLHHCPYGRPGARYVASPALRIARMPSSALSSTVVLTLPRCPGEMAAITMAAAVLWSGAS